MNEPCKISTMQPERLLARIASRDYTVGVMGMGYVGLPLAIAAIKAGFRVLCHEYRRSKRRCATVREMKEGPSRSAIRC
jgi:UDP-N-acetyl-D-mannosaminuronate dehydrogenase